MFVTPPPTPLHETLASHVFGRLLPQREQQPGATNGVVAPVMTAGATDDGEPIPDLAQRVREVGEW